MIKKTYYLAGIKNKETGKVEIYSGGHGSPDFCILGNGLGKAYRTKRAALNRLSLIKTSYYKIYTNKFFEKNDFVIYKLETEISELENATE